MARAGRSTKIALSISDQWLRENDKDLGLSNGEMGKVMKECGDKIE